MSTTVLTEPKLQPVLPSDAPALCPALAPILGLVETPVLRFAHAPAATPAPSVRGNDGVPVPLTPARDEARAQPQPATTVLRRRARLDWDGITMILLMLACAAVGVYRLLWMGNI